MARRQLAVFLLLAVLSMVACGGSGQTELEPPAPAPTATVAPQLGVPVAVSAPVYKPLTETTEIVPNCGGGSEPVTKHPGLTTVSANSVEWEVGGQFGAGLRIGTPVFPVGVDLTGVIEASDRTKLEQSLQQGVSWDLSAAPGEIMTFVLSWEEQWQPAYVDVNFGNQDVRRINVNYRTGINSDIVNSSKQNCDGSQIVTPQQATLAADSALTTITEEPQTIAEVTAETSLLTPRPPFSISESDLAALNYGEVPIADVEACLSRVHDGPRPFKPFGLGDELPSNVLIASNLGYNGDQWTSFPVIPVCHNGGWGLFKSIDSFTSPYEGAYWFIVP